MSYLGSGHWSRYAYLILVVFVLCSGLLACRSSLPGATPAAICPTGGEQTSTAPADYAGCY